MDDATRTELTAAQRRSLTLLRWMIAACIALPLALFTYQGFASLRATRASADLEVARTRDIAREHAVKVFETIERSLSEVAEIVRPRSDADIRVDEKELHDRLGVIEKALPQLKSAWVLDAKGQVLVSSLTYPAAEAAFPDRDYFAVHRERDIGTYLGRVLIPRGYSDNVPFFSMSLRRPSRDGAFIGVLQASILPNYFEQFYRQIGFEPGATIVLARADGTILASHPPSSIDAQITAGGPIGREIARAPDAGLITATFGTDGVERRIAYERLASHPVYVAAGLSTDAINARWRRDFAGLLQIAVPGTLLLFGLLWLFLQRTRRLYAEAAHRERAEAALRENQRLDALGQLTGGVAHDFNNLLTVIGSSADMLRRGNLPEERRTRYIDAITDTVARASRLTGQLLAFARRQSLTPEIFDVADRIEGMSGMLATLVGSSIDLRIARLRDECFVEADGSQFETALINLVANARDAMPGGGLISVSIATTETAPPRLQPAPAPNGYCTVAVSDTGKGIPADQIGRVFEPFFTTKGIGRGTGLGLSQVFGFARQSHGDIAVGSVPDEGATFTLYLPREQRRKPAPPAAAPLAAQLAPRRLRVLVVDDNEPVLLSTSDALRERGFFVDLAGSATQVLARPQGLSGVDVVLTDIVMPGMSGLDLADELRRRHPRLPVVVTTGYSERIERDGEGDLLLIRKPYSIDALVAKLNGAVQPRETVTSV